MTTNNGKPPPNWEDIRQRFEVLQQSPKIIAQDYAISAKRISNVAYEEGWTRGRSQQVAQAIAESREETKEVLKRIHVRLLETLESIAFNDPAATSEYTRENGLQIKSFSEMSQQARLTIRKIKDKKKILMADDTNDELGGGNQLIDRTAEITYEPRMEAIKLLCQIVGFDDPDDPDDGQDEENPLIEALNASAATDWADYDTTVPTDGEAEASQGTD